MHLSEQLAVLRECADRIEAETIRIRLESDDIRVFITGTDAATALGLGGAGTNRLVRVEVPESELVRAHELLLADEMRMVEQGPWICGRCREDNDASFDICWSCAKPRQESDQQGRRADQTKPVPAAGFAETQTEEETVAVLDRNPYSPTHLAETATRTKEEPDYEEHAEENRANVRRALLSSVMGVMILIPLISFYSIFLLCRVAGTGAYRDPELSGRCWIAWGVNFLALGVQAFVFLGIG